MKNVVVKVINIILFIFSIMNFLLLIATAGAWMTAISGVFLEPAVSEPYKISFVGVLYGVLFALLLAVEIMFAQIGGKNYLEKFSMVINFAFVLFIVGYLTANISAFPFIFCGLGLSFSILGTMIMIPKTKS